MLSLRGAESDISYEAQEILVMDLCLIIQYLYIAFLTFNDHNRITQNMLNNKKMATAVSSSSFSENMHSHLQ